MDTSNFQLPIQFNLVKVLPTTKMFYRKYLCRVTLNVKGVLYIRSPQFGQFLYDQDEIHCLLNWRRWNFKPQWQNEEEVTAILPKLKLIHQTLKNVKHRIEHNTVSIFFNSINELEQLFSLDSGFVINDIIDITIPKTSQHVELLKNNYIIHPTTNYTLKVLYKGRKFNATEKRQLLNFFSNQLTSDLKINNTLLLFLKSTGRYYITSGYFYAKNEEHLTFLNLIAPGFIKKVERVVQICFD